MSSLVINLPMPPSANKLWRIANRRIIRSAEYKLWLASNSWVVKEQRKTTTVPGPFTLRLFVGRLSASSDLDNRIKPVLDCLAKGGAITNDRFCQRIECEWRSDISGVKAIIMATEERA